MAAPQLEYNPAQPDPYAHPTFPTQDLNEVRPTGNTIRRGRAWIFGAAIFVAMGGIIAFDKLSKSSTARATSAVTSYGVGNVPEPEVKAEAAVAEEKKEEQKKTGKPNPPPRRKSALGRSDAFDDPVAKRAAREVASWNPETKAKKDESFANRRKSALGN